MASKKGNPSIIERFRNNPDRLAVREKRNFLVFGEGGESVVSVSETPRKVESFVRSMVYSSKTGRPMGKQQDNMRMLVASKFVEKGLNIDAIADVLLDATQATNHKGLPDHPTRLKSAQLALTALGVIGPKDATQVEEPPTMILVEADIENKTPNQVIAGFMAKVRGASSKGNVREEDVNFSDSDLEELGAVSRAAVGETTEHDVDLGVHVRQGSRIDKLGVKVYEDESRTTNRAETLMDELQPQTSEAIEEL